MGVSSGQQSHSSFLCKSVARYTISVYFLGALFFLSILPHVLLSLVMFFAEAEVRFEDQVYTFHENDDEVEVCLTTFEDITYNFTVCLDISVQALDTQPATGV